MRRTQRLPDVLGKYVSSEMTAKLKASLLNCIQKHADTLVDLVDGSRSVEDIAEQLQQHAEREGPNGVQEQAQTAIKAFRASMHSMLQSGRTKSFSAKLQHEEVGLVEQVKLALGIKKDKLLLTELCSRFLQQERGHFDAHQDYIDRLEAEYHKERLDIDFAKSEIEKAQLTLEKREEELKSRRKSITEMLVKRRLNLKKNFNRQHAKDIHILRKIVARASELEVQAAIDSGVRLVGSGAEISEQLYDEVSSRLSIFSTGIFSGQSGVPNPLRKALLNLESDSGLKRVCSAQNSIPQSSNTGSCNGVVTALMLVLEEADLEMELFRELEHKFKTKSN